MPMVSKSIKEVRPSNERIQHTEGPQVQGHVVQHNERHHLLTIDETVVPCTPTEYRLLMQLLAHAERSVPFTSLLGGYPSHASLTWRSRRTLAQHISRVRAKIWPFGFDILCVIGCGYLLLPKPPEQLEQVPDTT
jgi:DNA-binding response OmpR family regulator